MKKLASKILIILFVLQLFIGQTSVKALGLVDSNIALTNYTVSNQTINKGDNFTVSITIKNNSAKSMDYVNLNVVTDNSSFYPTNGDLSIQLANPLSSGSAVTKSIPLTYDGGSNKRFNFQLAYKLNGETETSVDKSIGINAISISEIPAPTPVDTKKYVPKLSIVPGTMPTVQSGDTVNVILPIKCINGQPAKDITVSPIIDKDDNNIFVEDFNASKDIATINSNETQSVVFKFRISSSAVSKSYPIKINMDYSNLFGDNFSSQSTVYIKVIGAVAPISGIEITNIETTPNAVDSGGNINVVITTKNTGSAVIKNAKLYLNGIKDDVFSINGGTNRKTIIELLPGQEVKTTFTLIASQKAADGNYPVTAKVDCIDSSDKSVSDEQNFYADISKSKSTGVEITNIQATPDNIEPGDKFNIDVTAKNTGNCSLNNLEFYINGLNENVISINGSAYKKVLSEFLPGQEVKTSFTLIASENASDGNYPLTLKVDCKDSSNNVINDQQNYNIGIARNDSIIEINDITSPNSTISPNSKFKVGFTLLNTGNEELRNVKVSVTPDPAIVTLTPEVKVLTKLKPNNKFPMSYLFMVPRGAVNKNYPIQINVEYETNVKGQIVKQTANQYISAYVDSPKSDNNKKGVPKIIINKYSINPTVPKAGTNIKLNVSFLNTNAFKAVRNIKIYLTSSDGSGQTDTGNIFVPVNSSNTFYIDSILPNQSLEKQIELYIINDAKPKTYNLAANFEYEDDNGTEYKATEIIGVPVRPQAKVETSDFSLPAQVILTDPLSISFDLYNTGKSILRNLMVKSIGNFDVQSQNSFIGNLDVGNQEHYEADITPKKIGNLKGYVLITFEDEAGQKQEIRKEISTKVVNPPPVTNIDPNYPGGITGANSNSKTNKMIYIGAGIAVVLVLITVIIIFRKRRRKKFEEMMLGE